jgi:hypothetical protein
MEPLIAFGLKKFGRIRTAPDGSIMHTTQLSSYRILMFKTRQSTNEKITSIKETQINCLFGNLSAF